MKKTVTKYSVIGLTGIIIGLFAYAYTTRPIDPNLQCARQLGELKAGWYTHFRPLIDLDQTTLMLATGTGDFIFKASDTLLNYENRRRGCYNSNIPGLCRLNLYDEMERICGEIDLLKEIYPLK